MEGTQSGILMPHPQAAEVERQNAARVARRRAAAAQVERLAGGRDDLTRHGPRDVGGTFETLQAVPDAAPLPTAQLSEQDIMKFLEGFKFDPQTETVTGQSTLLQTQTLPSNLAGPGF